MRGRILCGREVVDLITLQAMQTSHVSHVSQVSQNHLPAQVVHLVNWQICMSCMQPKTTCGVPEALCLHRSASSRPTPISFVQHAGPQVLTLQSSQMSNFPRFSHTSHFSLELPCNDA